MRTLWGARRASSTPDEKKRGSDSSPVKLPRDPDGAYMRTPASPPAETWKPIHMPVAACAGITHTSA